MYMSASDHFLTQFCRYVEDLYTYMEPIFAADPLMLYDFICLCHKGDYQKLFQRIPVFLSLTLLSHQHLPHKQVSIIDFSAQH